MRLLALLLFLASTLFISLSPVYSADFHMEGTELHMMGTIENRDFYTFADFIGKHDVKSVVLQSGGGMFAPAVGIGTLVYKLKIETKVYGECLSSCAYIALAGSTLVLADTAIFGIHAPFTIQPDDSRVESFKAENDASWYLGSIGVPLSFTKKVMEVGPHDMWYLDPKTLVKEKVLDE